MIQNSATLQGAKFLLINHFILSRTGTFLKLSATSFKVAVLSEMRAEGGAAGKDCACGYSQVNK